MGNGKLLHLGESGAGLRMQAGGVGLLKSKGGVMRERAVLAPVHAFEICRMKTKRSVGFRKRESSDPKTHDESGPLHKETNCHDDDHDQYCDLNHIR